MGERKAVNKYYPPDFNPKIHINLDKYHNVHPLRERGKKSSQGIIIIRFEMPFSIFCNKCQSHIAKGVRFNAEKKCVDKYFSTVIWEFMMKCHICSNIIIIRTDPQNRTYIIQSGGKRKFEEWDEKDNGTYETISKEYKEKLVNNPMFRLEHQEDDKIKANKILPIVERLLVKQDRMKNDYNMNKLVRNQHRVIRNNRKRRLKDGEKLGLNNIELLTPKPEDLKQAKDVKFNNKNKHKNMITKKIKKTLNNDVFKDQYGAKYVRKKRQLKSLSKILRNQHQLSKIETIKNASLPFQIVHDYSSSSSSSSSSE